MCLWPTQAQKLVECHRFAKAVVQGTLKYRRPGAGYESTVLNTNMAFVTRSTSVCHRHVVHERLQLSEQRSRCHSVNNEQCHVQQLTAHEGM
eukprot:1416747-Amphidinium_carterae.1